MRDRYDFSEGEVGKYAGRVGSEAANTMRDDTRISFYVGEGRDGWFYPIVSTCTPLSPRMDTYRIGPACATVEEAEAVARGWEAATVRLLGQQLTKQVRYQW